MMPLVLAITDELSGQAIADFAVQHTAKHDQTFHLIYVVDLGGLGLLVPDMIGELQNEEKVRGQKILSAIASDIKDSAPDACIVEHIIAGSASNEILKLAADVKAGLIVMGACRSVNEPDAPIGSILRTVVHRAPCSTVIVRTLTEPKSMRNMGPVGLRTADLPEQMTSYGS